MEAAGEESEAGLQGREGDPGGLKPLALLCEQAGVH